MINRFCRRVNDLTQRDLAVVCAIAFQVVWMVVGTLTRRDPFPFVFLLTFSNVVQLVLIFVIANAQKGQHAQELHEKIDALHAHLGVQRQQ